jgi:uncharacterized repeat protein (TIGR01451 family)
MLRIPLTKMLVATSIALASVACAGSDSVTNITPRELRPLAASGPSTTSQSFVVIASKTSPDGYITVTLSSALGQDVTGVNDTYMWSAHNNSPMFSIAGVTLGSNWGDYCGGSCTPSTPTLISLGSGCAGQGASEIPPSAKFGAWCTPLTGVTLPPGETVSGTVTLRPGSGGPANYIVYSLYDDPVTGHQKGLAGEASIHDTDIIAPAAVDEQLSGSASTGSPAVGSNFDYNFQIKNAGPWGTFGNVTFTDVLPAGLTYVGYTATAGIICGAVGQTVTCQIPDQINQNGQSSTLSLTVTAPSTAQQILNTASIAFASPQTDSNTANNTMTIAVTSK